GEKEATASISGVPAEAGAHAATTSAVALAASVSRALRVRAGAKVCLRVRAGAKACLRVRVGAKACLRVRADAKAGLRGRLCAGSLWVGAPRVDPSPRWQQIRSFMGMILTLIIGSCQNEPCGAHHSPRRAGYGASGSGRWWAAERFALAVQGGPGWRRARARDR